MRTRLYNLFADMLDSMPPKALLRAIKLEHWMLEDDLLHHRIQKTKDVDSILNFCSFVEAAEAGWDIPQVKLPMTDIPVYRKIIRRLVDNGELPPMVKSKFDFSFFLTFLDGVSDN